MTERDAVFPHALSDVQLEMWKLVQDPSTSSDRRLELLGFLSLLSELVDVKVRAYHGDAAFGGTGDR